ncbi:hypothetical protein B0A54_16166 [Friedmanniomyces endolithicus]|uniref:Tyrosinase copper-binding domain-containing protein n=1 Tax=Friedmanniomyces endolithicus TaxID=329885 RepID=A0A4U0TXP9_9PEZI|nr:hypothetical protein LTS09_001318 [Friedmanniomyces endolithicus]KAK0309907.1 hypothetical protein LTR01_004105 [Friedmanniomyces endolithicus]KAK0826541.1 hypothetical protein LTR73_006406 [Friedmanniomyces endolithicus]TKA27271.1 hypothetical protein B0A54_16166 [Friedmanniomyces endolithicus]
MKMWPFKGSQQRYDAVAGDEEELKAAASAKRHGGASKPTRTVCIVAVVTIALFALVGLAYHTLHSPAQTQDPAANATPPPPPSENDNNNDNNSSSRCPQRREWRTLPPSDQQAYISAVLCLRTLPSTLQPSSNRTAYDDYPWIHSHVGYFTHNSAPFLPWHRYFLHIYEKTLREECGYTGSLVYWDWTLDSEALEGSPVFDAATGFGGDGEVGGQVTVGRSGRCVVDGPFRNVTADYYDVKFQPHCLSRGFRDQEGNLGHIDGHEISPESIEEVLSLNEYEKFVALMESRVHDAIPFGIAGDFETFTAPYDPLFFLHHTQLDRLWWLWQQRQPEKGLTAYGGHKERHSMKMASLEDEIGMRKLAPSIKVAQVMDLEGDFLCYRY